MKFTENTVVVCRKNMLAEVYCGYIIQCCLPGIEIIHTDALTKMDDATLEKVRGKDALIYGGYYRGVENHKAILEKANSMTVVIQDEDMKNKKEWMEIVTLISGKPCEQTLNLLSLHFGEEKEKTLERIGGTFHRRICHHLDMYLYDYPEDDDINFQNGVYIIDASNDLEKIKLIQSDQGVSACIEKGKQKCQNNLGVAQQRVNKSIEIQKLIGGKPIAIRVAEGDSPIVDSCRLLAKNSSSRVGAMFRHDIRLGKTFVSICCLKESGFEACTIAREWMNGGGSPFMGGCSREGLFFPHLE
jgi:hypothetical protein